ncbi:hypothetical protein ACS0TY_005584 [Phlomoides rotata]
MMGLDLGLHDRMLLHENRVKEEVNRAIDLILRSSDNQIGSSGSTHLQLKFHNNLPLIIYTGNKIVSEDGSPLTFALYDSASKKIVTCGPPSSTKVEIVVLKGDFVPEDDDFDVNVVHNRKGKRPLVTGEATVSLQDGIGCVSDVTFTDNSSWTRSGKFCLGVKLRSDFDGMSIRQGVSNAFRVMDHRGEFYRKKYPPSLDDEVWRLEKIAKDGASHKRLIESGVFCVRDFLRGYTTNEASLRVVLPKVSNKKWEAIIKHALTCPLDDKLYIYRTPQGTGLVFNSIHKAVRVTFDGLNFQSVDCLDIYQSRMVEDLKQHAYRNLSNWEDCETGPNICPQVASLHGGQGQKEMLMNINHSTISLPHDYEVEKDMQELDATFDNSFGMSDSSENLYIEQPTWASGGNPIEAQLSPHDFTTNYDF